MSLDLERRYILRGLAHEGDTSFVHEPALSSTVRRILRGMENEDKQKESATQLGDAYALHGPALVRCLLDHSFLLNVTHQAPDLFRKVLDALEKDLGRNPRLCNPLINELNRHVHSPHAAQKLIELILGRCAHVPGVLTRIIENRDAHFDLRRQAAEQAVHGKDLQSYPAILDFVVETSRSQGAEAYASKLRPLVELFGHTAKHGLELAVKSFQERKLGRHAPLILASFGDDFHDWFDSQPPKPSAQWIKVLALAWFRSHKSASRQKMLSTLIDDWCSRSDLADFITDEILSRLYDKPDYLSPAGAKAQQVAEFVGYDPERERQSAATIVEAADAGGRKWANLEQWAPRDRLDGRAAAAAYYQAPAKFQERILKWVQTRHDARFLSAAYYALLKPSGFRTLSPAQQLAVLRSPSLAARVQAACVRQLLEIADFTQEVHAVVQDLFTKIVRDSGGADSDQGDLS